MKRQTYVDLLLVVLIGVFAAVLIARPHHLPPSDNTEVQFTHVDVFIDSSAKSLAAYQFELAVERGMAEIVGLEGGESKAFSEPPYYDPAALHGKRIIVAAFNVGKDLPTGRTRVARLHMQISGSEKPQYAVKLVEACGPDGAKIAETAGTE